MAEVPRVHVHMTVSDLARSRTFYEAFLGGPPVKVKPGYLKFLPAFGPLNLALSEAPRPQGGGHVDHMGIQVESADVVLRELARVKAAGLPVREELGVNCCHANQDKFWVQDPDGVEWEVYVLNHDLEDDGVPVGGTRHVASATGLATSTTGLAVVSGGSCCSPA